MGKFLMLRLHIYISFLALNMPIPSHLMLLGLLKECQQVGSISAAILKKLRQQVAIIFFGPSGEIYTV
jgi:hypothetical protein